MTAKMNALELKIIYVSIGMKEMQRHEQCQSLAYKFIEVYQNFIITDTTCIKTS